MILEVNAQLQLFLSTVLIGVVVGFFFDMFKIFRHTFPHKNIFVQIEDLLFWIVVTVFVFQFMFLNNCGEIPFFSILGIVLGAILYFSLLSEYFLMIFKTIIHIIKYIISLLFTIILTPFKILISIKKLF